MMDNDWFAIRDRLRAKYGMTGAQMAPVAPPTGEALGGSGFLTELAGRLIFTAPATMLTTASQLPVELAERWEKASTGNPYMMWLQGRYVEAEKANRNGALWSTADLQFGEMSVKHGPLNWLHDDNTIIGCIADNAMVHPKAQTQQLHEAAIAAGYQYNGPADTYHLATGAVLTADQLQNGLSTTAGSLFSIPQPRPYMAAVSAVWRWVHHDKAHAIEAAADQNNLFYSMECVGREISCASDETHEGCGRSFEYAKAMSEPTSTCEHLQSRTSARRIVDPSFLGGAVIVPPSQPGWGAANVEVMRQSAALAEQTHEAAGDLSDAQWTALMAQVIRYTREMS